MKKLLAAMKPTDPGSLHLVYHLHRVLAGDRPLRSHKTVHASDVTSETRKFCAREFALLDVLGRDRGVEFLHTARAWAFEHSGDCADLAIRVFAEAGVAVGDWECRHCGHVHRVRKLPKRCKTCGCRSLRYQEVRVVSATSGVSGGIDMLADLGGPKLTIVEMKAVQKDDFVKLEAPLAEARVRTNLYMRLADEDEADWTDRLDVNRAKVLYLCKAGFGQKGGPPPEWGIKDGPWSPFKEYAVDRDDASVEPYCEPARALHEWRALDGKAPIPGGVCSTLFSKRAQQCPVAKECFSGNYM